MLTQITLSGTITGNANATFMPLLAMRCPILLEQPILNPLGIYFPTKAGDTLLVVWFHIDTVSSANIRNRYCNSSFKKIADGSVKNLWRSFCGKSQKFQLLVNQFLLPKNNGTTITAQANEYALLDLLNYAVTMQLSHLVRQRIVD